MWARPTSHTPRRHATQACILSRDQGNQPVKIKNHPPHTIWQDWSWIGSISGGKPPGCINLHPTQSMYISKWIQNTQASSLCKNYLRTSYLKYTVKIHDVPTNKQHEKVLSYDRLVDPRLVHKGYFLQTIRIFIFFPQMLFSW